VKLRLEFNDKIDVVSRTEALKKLLAVFESALRLLSPFMPFITEEIWHALYTQSVPAKSIAMTRFPIAEAARFDADAVSEMEMLQELIVAIRSLRKDLGVPEKEAVPVRLRGDSRVVKLADRDFEILERLARVSKIDVVSEHLTGANARNAVHFDVAVVYERTIDIAAERERLTRDIAKYEKGLAAAERQSGNEAFLKKAPPQVVEGLKKQEAETRLLLEKAREALRNLPQE